MATIGRYEKDERGRPRSVTRIETAGGTALYLLPVETFPGHVNNVYLIDDRDHPILFDVGTAEAHAQLEQRLEEARALGARAWLDDLRLAVVSHAHVDHFGGAHELARRGVPLAIHELDARVMANFLERRLLAARDLELFLRQTGLAGERSSALADLYRSSKRLFEDLEPQRRLRNGDRIGPGWRVLHVPGHCPGLICLAVDDVVLTADHLLSRITPLQSPHSITPFAGLENYLRSLEKLEQFGEFDLGLGAHEAPIRSVRRRIVETMLHHAERLGAVAELCAERPRTTAGIARALFGEQDGYGEIMALLEAGAHVEYLLDLGFLELENLEEVARDLEAAPRYRARRLELARERLADERARLERKLVH